jgi:hypothetical protein
MTIQNLKNLHAVLSSLGLGRVLLVGDAVRDVCTNRPVADPVLAVLADAPAHDAILHRLDQAMATPPDATLDVEQNAYVYHTRFHQALVDVEASQAPSSPDDVMASIDWNMRRFIYDGDRVIRSTRVEQFAVAQRLVLMHDRTPRRSLARGFRLAQRLGMVVNQADLVCLCRAVVRTAPEMGVDFGEHGTATAARLGVRR